jgi:pimeloyl-ACP methyl ester carboxylesterase
MRERGLRLLIAAAAICAAPLGAQDIAGSWQGTVSAAGMQFRQLFQVTKTAGGWAAVAYSLDEQSDPDSASGVALRGSHVTITFPARLNEGPGATYEGELDKGGRAIMGTLTQEEQHYALTLRRVSPKEAWSPSKSHTTRFVAVEPTVKLEVLDWGGSGPPMVFLAGLGNTAHIFDSYAPKFTPRYHVYGITRRGFGKSSAPTPSDSNYTATRLGDDVLAVLDSLHLARPVLVGHSIAGQELSAIGSRHPGRVAGLVYLDAGYWYAYYDSAAGNYFLDRGDLQDKLRRLNLSLSTRDTKAAIHALLESDLPRIEKDLRNWLQQIQPANDSTPAPPNSAIGDAILFGGEKFHHVPVPALAIFAVPHANPPRVGVDSATLARETAAESLSTTQQVNAFAAGIPSARIVRLPHANHFVFVSNEADVLREMNAFLATISP